MNRLPNTTARAQAGVMLLEALIGILIFSLGILSLVALQATSIQLTSDAKYRTDASLLANRLIGQMWASGLTLDPDTDPNLKTKFENGGDEYNTWLTDVQGIDGLPGIVAASSGIEPTLPTVAVILTKLPPEPPRADITITMRWRTPQMPTSGANSSHSHVVVSQIVRNP